MIAIFEPKNPILEPKNDIYLDDPPRKGEVGGMAEAYSEARIQRIQPGP